MFLARLWLTVGGVQESAAQRSDEPSACKRFVSVLSTAFKCRLQAVKLWRESTN